MFFLLDGEGQHIGPFKNREAVARFIKMMALSGEDWADNQVVEQGGEDPLLTTSEARATRWPRRLYGRREF